jgi:uncharacterized protein (TIGR03437 family)
VTASGDRRRIYGLSDTFRFLYDVERRQLAVLDYTSSPAQAPRTVSVAKDGSYFAAGWALNDANGFLMAQFPGASGELSIGSHAIDSGRGIIYAQVSRAGGGTQSQIKPELQVVDADNLRVRETLQLPENLAGKSVLTDDGSLMYSVSNSGVTILPVGLLHRAPRVQATAEDLVFRGNFCDRRVNTQEIGIVNPGGPATDFTLSSTQPGITFTPSSGVTPATVRVSVDPIAFQNVKGTTIATIEIKSNGAVNVPKAIRLLINNREPDQRGTLQNIPGRLVDMLPDPVRDRFYVLRQDANEVLVYDGTGYNLIAQLRTGNTPWSMAITFDRRFLLVGNDNSQIVNVYDLETLDTLTPIRTPGEYPRSVAASGNAIFAASRGGDGKNTILRLDLTTRTGFRLQSLGVFTNEIALDTMLVASPNGSSILAAQSDGNLLLYNATADTFTVSRKDTTALAGAIAASSFDQYAVGNTLYNSSLVPVAQLDSGVGRSSGFAFVDQFAFRANAPNASSPGIIQRVDLNTGSGIRPTRMVEAPVLGQEGISVFTRSVAPLYSRVAIVSLTTSGFTVLPWNYDASVAPPVLQRVANAADGSVSLATGGLVSIFGHNLSPVNMASRELPLPTALGESCLTVNGVPAPVLFVSANQINAQVPYNVEGNVTMILRTPGGVSDNFNVVVLPSAPGVFRSTAGPVNDVPTVVRASNNLLVTLSNPIHRGDKIVIYLTGLGRTNPAIDAGIPAPGDPAPETLVPATVTLGGADLGVEFAGLSPGQVGVYQINAQVSGFTPLGIEIPLVITQGGGSTTVSVRVVE